MVFDVLELHGEIVKSTPSVQEIEQEKFDRSFSLYYISKVDKAALEKEILNISEIETAKVVQVDKGSLAEMVRGARSDAVALDRIAQLEEAKQEVAAASAAVPNLEAGRKQGAAAAQPNIAPVANRTIRVDIERLDALMNLFSELLIDRGRLEQMASEVRHSALTETVEHMSRVSGDLQSIVLNLRMVPVDSVFNRFPRMIRDVAKSLNKKVELAISGAETELDRTVIDVRGSPLTSA
jgi:two-component system chemotaxis sensor kinase CheA